MKRLKIKLKSEPGEFNKTSRSQARLHWAQMNHRLTSTISNDISYKLVYKNTEPILIVDGRINLACSLNCNIPENPVLMWHQS